MERRAVAYTVMVRVESSQYIERAGKTAGILLQFSCHGVTLNEANLKGFHLMYPGLGACEIQPVWNGNWLHLKEIKQVQ